MNTHPSTAPVEQVAIIEDLLTICETSLNDLRLHSQRVRRKMKAIHSGSHPSGAPDFNRHQFALHAFAWTESYCTALTAMLSWARSLEQTGRFEELEKLILQAAFGEYLSQIDGGIPMSQSEIARPQDLGVDPFGHRRETSPATRRLLRDGNTASVRQRIAELLVDHSHFGHRGITDETLALMQEQSRRFVETSVAPFCHEWHIKDILIPTSVISGLSNLGVFGLTISENHGGLGLGKLAMCLITEELSRGNLAVGSLATRSEIAADLISANGTTEQKEKWLPLIASGRVLPAAAFTEPGAGSDLGAVKTKAVSTKTGYRISGSKTWITHAARAGLLLILARTDAAPHGNRGLSMFLAEKTPGDDADAFPVAGIEGSEIRVLGYRGMKEYELTFDDFAVDAKALLGSEEMRGFRQLMATFESARIQTAARAVGVAQNALEVALAYARERHQFGKPLVAYPRISGKIAQMIVETMVARQLTYHVARLKDLGGRCDIEAGMAKLLSARVAWANADSALQIHGGNGYAEEYEVSRILCDARILGIFEGATEIQAGVIARGILSMK